MPPSDLRELRDKLCRDVHVVTLPLRRRFRGITERELLLFRGREGWGEFSPFTEYPDEVAATWLRAALELAWEPVVPPANSTETVAVNATVPAVPASEVAEVLAAFPGCRTAKVKVAEPGQSLDDATARVREVRRTLGASGRIRLDANAAWNVTEATEAIRAFAEFDLEYVEQPCRTVAELAELRRRISDLGVAVAADESIRQSADPLAVRRLGAADVVIVKVQPLGGIRPARELAEALGLPVVVSSALESSVGLAAGTSLAAQLSPPKDAGLGTAALFASDVCSPPRIPHDGRVSVGRADPDSHLLRTHAAPRERRDWWVARLDRALGILQGRGDLATYSPE